MVLDSLAGVSWRRSVWEFLPISPCSSHSSLITSEQDDYWPEFVQNCKWRKIANERLMWEDALLCLVFWPGWWIWPLALIEPQPFRLLVVWRLPPCDRRRQIPFSPDDSGVPVCFLPLPKPSTCLPVLCRGSVSVHTAVSGLGLQQSCLKIDTTANNIRKVNHCFFFCPMKGTNWEKYSKKNVCDN